MNNSTEYTTITACVVNGENESENHSVMSDSLQPCGLYSPWNSSGQNTRVGTLSLLQGFFTTQGLNPSLPCCRWILYQLSHKGSPIYWKLYRNNLVCMCVCSVNNLCPILCDPVYCNRPGSSVKWIFPERILEWVASSFSRRCSQPRDQRHIFCFSGIGRRILYHWTTWEATQSYFVCVCVYIYTYTCMLLLRLSRISRVRLCVTP